MASFQKMAFNLGAILCITLAAVFIILNGSTLVSLKLLPGNAAVTVSLGFVMLGFWLLGTLGALFKYWQAAQQLKSSMKQYELRREKAEVKAEVSTDQIRSLESKIQTLEKALQQALASASGKQER